MRILIFYTLFAKLIYENQLKNFIKERIFAEGQRIRK